MEVKVFNPVFQTDSKIVKLYYKNDNYKIEYNDKYKESKQCVIYFCSNDIYFPNNEEVFTKKIIDKDFYEWYGTRVLNTYKHIFVRDIQKQWYIEGINERINTPELLHDFLKKETSGYSLITLGSSAGGYAAVLYGSLLSAKIVLSFNGQFELNSLLKNSSPEIDPLLFRNNNTNVAKFFELKDFINKKIKIYYFTSIKSIWDKAQYEHVKDIDCIQTISFKTAHHGVPFVKSALPFVINLDLDGLDSLSLKIWNPLYFSIKQAGLIKTFITLFKQLKQKLKQINN